MQDQKKSGCRNKMKYHMRIEPIWRIMRMQYLGQSIKPDYGTCIPISEHFYTWILYIIVSIEKVDDARCGCHRLI
jgi:hypothetical protein